MSTATIAPSASAEESFDSLLAQLGANPALVEGVWSLSNHQNNAERASGGDFPPSQRRISARANDMITMLEVSSRARYESRYTRPVWPGGRSGVTIGIGYDLAFPSREHLERDWGGLLPAESMEVLRMALQLQGAEAEAAIPRMSGVVIGWEPARQQFQEFLPYPTAQAEAIFPNSDKLSNDSFGALVSLVYNRGPQINAGNRRREMREIQRLMTVEEFAAIPEQIRNMKRLWNIETQRGLHIRRDLEARLFELGLS